MAVPDHRAQPDIVDLALNAIFVAATIEGELEFSGQALDKGIAHERVGGALRIGTHIEDLIGGDAGPNAGSNVADGVEASLTVGHPDIGEQVHEIRHARERNEMILHVLAGRDMAPATAELVGNAA